MTGRLVRCLVVIGAAAGIVGATAPAGSVAAVASSRGCAHHEVLLLGSYPGEVSANLQRERLDVNQPTVVAGHRFYAGRLRGHQVVLGIAGPSPAVARKTTALALRHFRCVSAVAFSGTAGGGGRSGLGDVTIPGRWTGNQGKTFDAVDRHALRIARSLTGRVAKLGRDAAVDDGPCACSGLVDRLDAVPILRAPRLVVGGKGISYGGQSDTCSVNGGQLAGCDPCPPSTTTAPADRRSRVTAGATSSRAAARRASRAMRQGLFVAHPRRLLAHRRAPLPPALARPEDGSTTAGTTYIADDQQTFGSMAAAKAAGVPFIAFRGISDTASVGDLWPFEYLVYQQLAADNAAVAERIWLGHWHRGTERAF
jgi:hypothetical protein